MPKKETKDKETKKRGRKKKGNTRPQFKKKLPEIIRLIENGASYSVVKNFFGMTDGEWNKIYEENAIDIKQARARRQMGLISKTNDLAINHNNFNALRMLLINETELQDKVEQKVETAQAVNIVDNTEQMEQIETLGENNGK